MMAIQTRCAVLCVVAAVGCTGTSGTGDVPDAGVVDEPVAEVIIAQTISGYRDDVGVAARFNGITGMAQMNDGRVLVSDRFNSTLRLIDTTTDIVTTISGALQTPGYVDGTLAEAQWSNPYAVAADDQGRAWVADGGCVRLVDVAGDEVATVAGRCGEVGQVDGPLTMARFGRQILAMQAVSDDQGTLLYVVDRDNNALRVIDLDNDVVTTLADFEDGLFGPTGLVVQLGARVALVTNTGRHTLLQINLDTSDVTTVVGVTDEPGDADGDFASARLRDPQSLALLDSNQLVVGGVAGDVRLVSLDADAVRTLTTHSSGFFGQAASVDGHVWLSDADNAIVDVTLDRQQVRFGTERARGHRDGVGADARFGIALSMISDDNGGLYLTDYLHHTVRFADVASGTMTTIAGQPGVAGDDDGAPGTATLRGPSGLVLRGRTLYISETDGFRVRTIDLDSGVVQTLAGSGNSDLVDGVGTAASFGGPRELVLRNDVLYVADHVDGAGVVREVNINSGEVSTLSSGFAFPRGMTLASDQLWMGDFEAHVMYRIDLDTRVAEPVLGAAYEVGAIDGGRFVARLYQPNGMGAASGYVLLTELGNQRLRRIDSNNLGSRFFFNRKPGSMPQGVPTPLSDATMLNPLDAVVVREGDADMWYVVVDSSIMRVGPFPAADAL
jgi:DNA-binding beta-propeller fold protein YncE